ncbi:MAG TPA: 4-hydroxy-tetrahydrodipicolinate synthase [Acidobacteria bacterium]|nr:4-hydroxy-tetrahydrodipicolinate synthase [Acidobacteriota bacterium]
MSDLHLRGVLTALITPFDPSGEIDLAAFRELVDRQLAAGVHGLVPCGTTGETPALSDEEWAKLVGICVEAAAGRVPVVPGTGANNTPRTVALTRRARELGADAALVVTPYYNKPNPRGLVAHYRAVAEVGLPVVLYNVPSRTGSNVPAELVLEIAENQAVVAVKEASGQLSQAMSLVAGRPRETFSVLSGEDELTCAMTLMGGDGVISVVSNVDPAGVVEMVEAALEGDARRARREHYRLLALTRALFAETNPVPAKAALAALGLCRGGVRPPLAPASESTVEALRRALAAAGLS